MPMPVRLCQFDLPNGKLCRQVAIKDQYVCRHHILNFRDADQLAAREVAMERLEDRLNQMDLPELLLTLERKLKRIVRTMPVFDEARVTLGIAIEQLHRQNEENAPGIHETLIQQFLS